MPVITELLPEDGTSSKWRNDYYDYPLRRLDLDSGRVLYFRAAHTPLHTLDADDLWTALGLDDIPMGQLTDDAIGAICDAYTEATWQQHIPLAIRHHDGAITIADLAGANCTTISTSEQPGLLRRILRRR